MLRLLWTLAIVAVVVVANTPAIASIKLLLLLQLLLPTTSGALKYSLLRLPLFLEEDLIEGIL